MENKLVFQLKGYLKTHCLFKNHLVIPSVWSIVMSIFVLMSCRDDDNELKPDPTQACFLLQENLLDEPRHTHFEYNSGTLTHIIDFRKIGDPLDVTEIYPEKTLKTNVDKIYPTYISTLIEYDADIFTGSPSVASTFTTVSDVTQPDRTFRFRYDEKRRLIEVKQHAPSSSIKFTLTIEYDKSNNVKQLHYTYLDYPETKTILITGYDSKPTPYSGIKGWKFIESGNIWSSTNPFGAITALSQNNPRGYAFFVNDKETYTMSYEYQYNEHGFPTQRDQVYKTATSASQATYVYSYQCP